MFLLLFLDDYTKPQLISAVLALIFSWETFLLSPLPNCVLDWLF